MATGDLVVVQRQDRVIHLAANHEIWIAEVVVIVGVGTAERDDGSDRVATTPGPTTSLLVIGSRRRTSRSATPDRLPMSSTHLHGGRA